MKLRSSPRGGFSLLELLAVVLILGTLAAIIVPRINITSIAAAEKADAMNRAQINSAVERYYIQEGDWPANNLSDIGSDINYFPDGVPTNPVNNLPYFLNSTTHRVQDGISFGK